MQKGENQNPNLFQSNPKLTAGA